MRSSVDNDLQLEPFAVFEEERGVLGPASMGVLVGKQLSPPVVRAVSLDCIEKYSTRGAESKMVQPRSRAVMWSRESRRFFQHHVCSAGVDPCPSSRPIWIVLGLPSE